MRRAVAFALVGLAGASIDVVSACGGSVGREPDSSARPVVEDGGTSSSFGIADARPLSNPNTLRRCLPGHPFDAPVPIPGFSTTYVETSPHLTGDELMIVFARLEGERGFYVATRSSGALPFTAPVRLAIDGDLSNADPMITHDGLAIFFSSNPGGGTGGSDIWVSRRASKTEPFGAAILFAAELADGGLDEPVTSSLSAGADGHPVPSTGPCRSPTCRVGSPPMAAGCTSPAIAAGHRDSSVST